MNAFAPLKQVQHFDAVTAGAPHPKIWNKFINHYDGQNGVYHFDHFTNFGGRVTTNVGSHGGWVSFVDTSSSLATIDTGNDANARTGILRLLTDTTDNANVALQAQYGQGTQVQISDTAANKRLVVFEARFRVGQVGNTYNMFLGLAEEGLAVNDGFFADNAAIADKDYLGFIVTEDAGATLKFGYNLAGQTDVVKIAALKTLVADTWYSVGFVHDPDEQPSRRLAVYLDGVKQSTYVTDTNIATSTGSAFPDGQGLSMLAHLKNQTTSAQDVDIDFMGVGMTL
jgi:hypothetical protein